MTGNNNNDENQKMVQYNRKLKKQFLDIMFRESEAFFIHCAPHPGLNIGRRGLLDKEKTEGIVLVFGEYSSRNLSWDDNFLYCELQFQKRWEFISIPYECILKIFDKEAQFLIQCVVYESKEDGERIKSASTKAEKEMTEKEKRTAVTEETDSKIIEVDFSKKKSKKKGDE